MKNLADLNERAQESFNKVKRNMKLNLSVNTLQENKAGYGVYDLDKFEKAVAEGKYDNDNITPAVAEKLEDNMNYINNSFDFIESLNLPPQLSLAIGYIISHSKTNKIEEIESAIKTLVEYLPQHGGKI